MGRHNLDAPRRRCQLRGHGARSIRRGPLHRRQFNSAGNQPQTSHIAKWDGSTWSSVGGGANHFVRALYSHNGTLYAGGSFPAVGNIQVNQIAAWDGANWSALDTGVFGRVFSLGSFSVAGATVAPGLARWSDTNTPWFAQQPSDAEACFGETRQLHAALALGYESATLQWRRNGEPLTDGPTGYGSTLSGTTTGTLTITDIHAPDDAIYVCLAQSDCDSVPSDEARLTLCIADYNCDGSVSTLDVLAFLNAWNAGC